MKRRNSWVESGRSSDAVAEEVKTVKEQGLAEWMPKLTSDETPINPYRVVWDLNQAVDRTQTIVTHDSGNPRDQTLPFYEAITPHGYIGWGQVHAVGIRTWLDYGRKDGCPGKTRRQYHGRRRIRYGRNGL